MFYFTTLEPRANCRLSECHWRDFGQFLDEFEQERNAPGRPKSTKFSLKKLSGLERGHFLMVWSVRSGNVTPPALGVIPQHLRGKELGQRKVIGSYLGLLRVGSDGKYDFISVIQGSSQTRFYRKESIPKASAEFNYSEAKSFWWKARGFQWRKWF